MSHSLCLVPSLSLILLLFFSSSTACRYNHHCNDADPSTLDICYPHARICLNPSLHQSQNFITRTLSSLIQETNAQYFPLAHKHTVLNAARRLLFYLNPHRFLHLNVLHLDPVILLTNYASTLNATTSNYAFHTHMIHIFQQMNDFHTVYLTPNPLSSTFALLPISIAIYYDKNNNNNNDTSTPRRQRLYVIDDITAAHLPSNTTLRRGSQLLTYDNLPIDRAVRRAGRAGFGANRAAQLRNGVLSLTTRVLLFESAPTRRSVRITYRNDDGAEGAVKLDWRFIQIHDQRMAGRMSRVYAHLRPVGLQEQRVENGGRLGEMREWLLRMGMGGWERISKGVGGGRRELSVKARYSELFSAEIVRTKVGRVGHVRIKSFDSFDIRGTVAELRRVLRQMPRRGLVVDIRGNGGGREEMVKAVVEMVHGVSIRRQILSVRSTGLVSELVGKAQGKGVGRAGARARARAGFFRWFAEAVGSAERVGEEFSGPVEAPYESAYGEMRRAYFGAVVTVVDGRTYSAGDIYAKLMVDEGLSVVVGADANVGAGGAAGVLYSELVQVAPRVFGGLGGEDGRGVDFGMAFARMFRGGRKSGVLVERFGVKPDVRYYYTKRDTLDEDCDMLEFLGRLLVRQGSGGDSDGAGGGRR